MPKVAFRKSNDEITAVFPEFQEGNLPSGVKLYTCYTHIGQHGMCCQRWVQQNTIAAKPSEYAALLAELQNIGYTDIKVVTRIVKWA